jgi:hypothetical protein
MLKTYTGHFHEGVEVVVMGESYGHVKPGESIVIPDEIAEQVAWPEDIWINGPPPKESKKNIEKE